MDDHLLDEIDIGSWVSIDLSSSDTQIIGTVKFIGETNFADGIWLGLVLIDECRKFAKNNGIINDYKYFSIDDDLIKSNSNNINNINFGLFVRPQTVKLLKINDLILSSNISSTTKLNLLFNYINSLNSKLLDYSENLEKSQIEFNYLLSESNSLKTQLNDLILNNNVLKSSLNIKNNDNSIIDSDLSLKNKKLELSIIQLKENFQQTELNYLESINSLKLEISNLEKKLLNLNNNNLNNNLLSDLNSSELIIEKLTSQNSDLLIKIDELQGKINELQKLINLNNDIINYYEQSEKDLNISINQLNENLSLKNNELLICEKSLNDLNKKLSLKEISNSNNLNNELNFNKFFESFLKSLNLSFNEFSTFLLNNLILNKDLTNISNLLMSLLNLKYYSNIIINYCLLKSIDFQNWSSLLLKIEFLLQIINYDESFTLLKYKKYIDDINSFIFDNVDDINLLLSMSFELPLDLISYYDNNLFESTMVAREILIYYINDSNSNLCNDLIQARTNNKGIIVDKSLIKNIKDKNFKNLENFKMELIDLNKSRIWNSTIKQKSNIETNNDNMISSEIYNDLELKVQILQSKLMDERKLQKEIIQLEKELKNHEEIEMDLRNKLDSSIIKEKSLNLEIQDLDNLLIKFGLKKTSKLVDEFNVLDKSSLLNTIINQRLLISKLTNYGQINEQSKFKDCSNELDSSLFNPISKLHLTNYIPYYRRLDNLFELCNTSILEPKNNHSYNNQKILEYFEMS